MKKRKSIIILSSLNVLTIIASVILFVLLVSEFGKVINNIVAFLGVPFTKYLISLFKPETSDIGLLPSILTICIDAVALIVLIVWISVGIKRKSKFTIIGSIITLLTWFETIVIVPTFTTSVFASNVMEKNGLLKLIMYICSVLSFVLLLSLFVCDLFVKKTKEAKLIIETYEEDMPLPSDEVKEENKEVIKTETITEKKESVKKDTVKKSSSTNKKQKNDETKVYHVSKRLLDNKWTVKFSGGEKVVKTFFTQAEACTFADGLAKKQGGIVLVHASKGKKQGKIIKKL